MNMKALLVALVTCSLSAVVQGQMIQVYMPPAPINAPIDDGSTVGVISTINVPFSSITEITSVTLTLNITGGFNGDFYAYLAHYTPGGASAGFVTLLNRVGTTASNAFGYGDAGFDITFSDAGLGDIHNYQTLVNPGGGPLTGFWQPDGRTADPSVVTDLSPRTNSLASFNGGQAAGDWILFIADLSPVGTGTFVTWELTIQGVPEPGTWAAASLAALMALQAFRRRNLKPQA